MDRKAAYGGYTWLNNRAIEVGGQRFVGTPLWANFCGDPLSMIEASRGISDFDQIWFGKGRRLTSDIIPRCAAARRALQAFLWRSRRHASTNRHSTR